MSANRRKRAEKHLAGAMKQNLVNAAKEKRREKARELHHEASKYNMMVSDYDDIAARQMPDNRDVHEGCNVYAYNAEDDEYVVLATNQRIVRGRWHQDVKSSVFSCRSIPVFHIGGAEYSLDIPPANFEVI
jgi:hypothetical protein